MGAILGYFYFRAIEMLIPFVLAVSAASFIYIALADLIPGLHRTIEMKDSIMQFIFLISGIGTIALFVLQH